MSALDTAFVAEGKDAEGNQDGTMDDPRGVILDNASAKSDNAGTPAVGGQGDPDQMADLGEPQDDGISNEEDDGSSSGFVEG